jgi:uncharacterized protein
MTKEKQQKQTIESLKKEAEKQFLKATELRKKTISKNKKGEKMLQNIDAYLADYKYFLVENKPIEAFEAIVWAWAWLEIGEENKFLEFKK